MAAQTVPRMKKTLNVTLTRMPCNASSILAPMKHRMNPSAVLRNATWRIAPGKCEIQRHAQRRKELQSMCTSK